MNLRVQVGPKEFGRIIEEIKPSIIVTSVEALEDEKVGGVGL